MQATLLGPFQVYLPEPANAAILAQRMCAVIDVGVDCCSGRAQSFQEWRRCKTGPAVTRFWPWQKFTVRQLKRPEGLRARVCRLVCAALNQWCKQATLLGASLILGHRGAVICCLLVWMHCTSGLLSCVQGQAHHCCRLLNLTSLATELLCAVSCHHHHHVACVIGQTISHDMSVWL